MELDGELKSAKISNQSTINQSTMKAAADFGYTLQRTQFTKNWPINSNESINQIIQPAPKKPIDLKPLIHSSKRVGIGSSLIGGDSSDWKTVHQLSFNDQKNVNTGNINQSTQSIQTTAISLRIRSNASSLSCIC